MNTDPIADYLTRIRNAVNTKHRIVEIPASNIKKAMTQILSKRATSSTISLKKAKRNHRMSLRSLLSIIL